MLARFRGPPRSAFARAGSVCIFAELVMVTRAEKTLASVLVAAFLSSPLAAFAQTDEQRAAARELATAGADAFDDGKYDLALENFKKAESLVHALPHLLFIARAHAKRGEYVKSREAYLKVIKEELPSNAPRAWRDAQQTASAEVSSVEPKIGRVTVVIANRDAAKDLVVSIDGVAIASVLVGSPLPIDPGDHVVEGVATGLRGKTAVRVAAGQRREVPLRLDPDATALPPPPPPVPVAAAATQAAPPAETHPAANEPPPPPPPSGHVEVSEQRSTGTGMRVAGYVSLGLGAAGIATGTVFMLQYSSKMKEADDLCTLPGGECDKSVKPKVDALDADAKKARNIGIVGLAVGGAALGTGIMLLVLAPSGSATRTATITPWFGLNSAGVRGTF